MAVAPDGFSDVGGLDGTALSLRATGCCTLQREEREREREREREMGGG